MAFAAGLLLSVAQRRLALDLPDEVERLFPLSSSKLEEGSPAMTVLLQCIEQTMPKRAGTPTGYAARSLKGSRIFCVRYAPRPSGHRARDAECRCGLVP